MGAIEEEINRVIAKKVNTIADIIHKEVIKTIDMRHGGAYEVIKEQQENGTIRIMPDPKNASLAQQMEYGKEGSRGSMAWQTVYRKLTKSKTSKDFIREFKNQ